MWGQMISGLKQCGALHLLRWPRDPSYALSELLADLAAHHINIVFATTTFDPSPNREVILAVPAQAGPLALKLAALRARMLGIKRPLLDRKATALNLYPRGRGLLLPTRVWQTLQKKNVLPLGMGTSLAALTLVLHEDHLMEALDTLPLALGLPRGASPPDAGLECLLPGQDRKMPSPEISTRYAEKPIMVYHLSPETKTVLLSGVCREPLTAFCGSKGELNARTVFFSGFKNDGLYQFMACAPFQDLNILQKEFQSSGLAASEKPRPVSLFHLQGPHFGDRPGIAANAFAALEQAGVRPLAFAAVMHSLFLFIDPQKTAHALKGLSRFFCTP
jgi:aspartokinase